MSHLYDVWRRGWFRCKGAELAAFMVSCPSAMPLHRIGCWGEDGNLSIYQGIARGNTNLGATCIMYLMCRMLPRLWRRWRWRRRCMLIVVFITVIVVEIYYWPWCQVRLTFVLKPLECRLHHYSSYPLMSYGKNPPVCMSIVICSNHYV